MIAHTLFKAVRFQKNYLKFSLYSLILILISGRVNASNDSNSTARADFDGDQRTELASGKFIGRQYQIKIQFNNHKECLSFVPEFGTNEVLLTAIDVDHDGDNDLLVLTAESLRPIAVWLNDGHGNFSRTREWWCANSSGDFPLENVLVFRVFKQTSEHPVYALPLDSGVFTLPINGLKARAAIAYNPWHPSAQFIAPKSNKSGFTARSPPII